MTKITISEAAKILGVSANMLSVGIRNGAFRDFSAVFPNPKTKKGYSIIIFKEPLLRYKEANK